MQPTIIITPLDPADKDLILKIARWYFREWNTPIDKTVRLLTTYPNEVVLIQVILTVEGEVVATGSIRHLPNILNRHGCLSQFGPWLGALYTQAEYRRQGLGKMLLENLEREARKEGLSKIYLYTFTAESLYKRCGWKVITRVTYKDHDTVVMEKDL